MTTNKPQQYISKIKKYVKCYFDIEKVDIEDIPMMKYPKDAKCPKIAPYIQRGWKNSSRLIYRRR